VSRFTKNVTRLGNFEPIYSEVYFENKDYDLEIAKCDFET